MSRKLVFLILTTFSSLQYLSVSSFEYQVGGIKGWVVPPSNDTRIYNDWASENRFQVGDTVCFKYRKDSVMEVSIEDYKKCDSSHPNFFSNTGNTLYHLNHSGPFYFISGVSGHCEKGQRMIIKVISSTESTSSSSTPGSGSGTNSAASPSAQVSLSRVLLPQLVGSLYVAYSCLFY